MDRSPRQNLLILACLGLILGLHLLHLWHYFFLTDDAFISFRYLHNWIEGRGLVFNPGERVEGYTNFLWIMILAPFALLHLPPERVAPILSSFLSALLLVMVFFFPRLARREKEIQPGWLLAPLLLALNRSYAVWASSGLETRLFTWLIFLAAAFAWRTSQARNRRDPVYTGIFFALAELCRPEATLFFATAAALIVTARAIERRPRVQREDAAGLAVFVAAVAAHFLGRHLYYGSWLPNTYYAKVMSAWWSMGYYYLGVFILEYSYWMWAPLLVGFGLRWIRARDWLFGFLLAFPLPYLVYLAYLGGDHFEYRFLDPVLPFLALLLQECLRRFSYAGCPRWRKPALAAFTLGFLSYSSALPWLSGLGFQTEYALGGNPSMDFQRAPWLRNLPGLVFLAGVYQRAYPALTASLVGIRAEEHRRFCLRQIGQGELFQGFLERGYLQLDETIAIGSVGALPYYTGLRTVDFYGLTDAVIGRMKPRRAGRAMYHDKTPADFYLQERKVDYVLLGNYLQRRGSESEPPALRIGHPLALQNWTDRIYLVQLDDWLLRFESPLPPPRLLSRFQARGLPIFIYLAQGEQAFPVPLARALELRPELQSDW